MATQPGEPTTWGEHRVNWILYMGRLPRGGSGVSAAGPDGADSNQRRPRERQAGHVFLAAIAEGYWASLGTSQKHWWARPPEPRPCLEPGKWSRLHPEQVPTWRSGHPAHAGFGESVEQGDHKAKKKSARPSLPSPKRRIHSGGCRAQREPCWWRDCTWQWKPILLPTRMPSGT